MHFRLFALGAAATAVALAGCGAAAAHDPATTAHATASTHAAAATHVTAARAGLGVDAVTAIAQKRYDQEVSGGSIHRNLRIAAHDTALMTALRNNDMPALRAAAVRLQAGHDHFSRIRIIRGGKKIVDVGVPFCVAGSQKVLKASDGKVLGTLEISIQDEIGVVRLIHRNYPVDVVIRGAGGQVRTSLPAARDVALPASGTVTIAGKTYQVRSFQRKALDDEAVTVWILGTR